LRVVALGALIAVLTLRPVGAAEAQTIFGVSLGDSEARARELLGRSFNRAEVVGNPGAVILWGDRGSAKVCDDRVVKLEAAIGSRIHDYTATVEKEELRRGPAAYQARNSRTQVGEISEITANWPEG
jgi:hypothetical protein